MAVNHTCRQKNVTADSVQELTYYLQKDMNLDQVQIPFRCFGIISMNLKFKTLVGFSQKYVGLSVLCLETIDFQSIVVQFFLQK